MNRKQIDALREVRLSIVQLVVPAITLVSALLTIPEVKTSVNNKLVQIKARFKKRGS